MSATLSAKIGASHLLLYKFSQKIDQATQKPTSEKLRNKVKLSFEKFIPFYKTDMPNIKKEADESGSAKLQLKTSLLQQRTEIIYKKVAQFKVRNFERVKEIQKHEKALLHFEQQLNAHKQPKAQDACAQETEQKREEQAKSFSAHFTKGAQTAVKATRRAKAKAVKAEFDNAFKTADSKAKTTFCPWKEVYRLTEPIWTAITEEEISSAFEQLPKLVQLKIKLRFPQATTGPALALAMYKHNLRAEYKDFIFYAQQHTKMSKEALEKLSQRYPYETPVHAAIQKEIKNMAREGNCQAKQLLKTEKWNGSVIAEAAERNRVHFNHHLEITFKALKHLVFGLMRLELDTKTPKRIIDNKTFKLIHETMQTIIPLWGNVKRRNVPIFRVTNQDVIDLFVDKFPSLRKMHVAELLGLYNAKYNPDAT